MNHIYDVFPGTLVGYRIILTFEDSRCFDGIVITIIQLKMTFFAMCTMLFVVSLFDVQR